MPTPWNQYPINNPWNPPHEYGVDVATPFHTPITALYGGTVERAYNSPWGENVVIGTNLPGVGPVNEYVQHLDTLASNLAVGMQVHAGEFLGLSGGETQAQVQAGLFPGAQSPNSPQYSSGPHTEFGFGAPWQGGGPNFNPASYLSGTGIGTGQVPSTGGNVGTSADPCLGCGPKGSAAYLSCLAASFGSQGIGSLPPCAKGGTTVVQDVGSNLASSGFLPGLQQFATTQALPYLAGGILIIIGLWALLKGSPVTIVTAGGLTKGTGGSKKATNPPAEKAEEEETKK